MSETHYQVQVQEDHLERLASARPIQAIAELVWNSLDADAHRAQIEFESRDFGKGSILVKDDGHGIPHKEVEHLFGKLGGSWKSAIGRSKQLSRLLHGKDGKGRFKALALGRVALWNVTYAQDDRHFSYEISLIKDNLVDVRVTDPVEVSSPTTGVEVRILELHNDFRSLEDDTTVQELSEIFAFYLSDYKEVSISFQGERLDPSSAIRNRKTFSLDPVIDNGNDYSVVLELIEWKAATERVLYLCTAEGFPLQRLQPRIHTPGFQFSGYLKSSYIDRLHKEGLLDLAEMLPPLLRVYETAQERIKEFFHQREIETSQSQIDEWKSENVYPYKGEPQNSVDEVERKVFDIVALNINRHLSDFSTSTNQNKAFQLRMLRQAIERGPKELQLILTEVLDLPVRKRNELAKLLEEASLANIISASKLVADRLRFLQGLETLLFDVDLKKYLKERSQLHRILADENTWVFGEEFNLTVSDQSLTEVLRKHVKLVGSDVVIDRPVTKVDGSRGIVDLMLSRSVPRNYSDEREHLVVELKAPKVKVGSTEITQIKEYAYAVAADERFRHLKTRWSFWVISNDLDAFAERETRQKDKPRGLVTETDDGQIKVWVKTWSETIMECNSRLRFVQEQLKYNLDKTTSLDYLKKTYDKYVSGIAEVTDDDLDEAESGGTGSPE